MHLPKGRCGMLHTRSNTHCGWSERPRLHCHDRRLYGLLSSASDADTGAADTGAAEMTTLRIGKLIYCSTKIRHDLAIFDEPARHLAWRFWWSY